MENHWESIFSNATIDHPYLPNCEKPIYILGRKYESMKDRSFIEQRLRSLFWMTYRKDFSAIGASTGPKSDAGWGCMHRCGQMMLAQAIQNIRLGQDWMWTPGCKDEEYLKLRRMFQDRKGALYSIHNIVQTGAGTGKPIASWFGPNTVALVMKQLTAYDQWSDLAVHICVEAGVIIDEIKARCFDQRSHLLGVQLPVKSDVQKSGSSDTTSVTTLVNQNDPTHTDSRRKDFSEDECASDSSSQSGYYQFPLQLCESMDGDWNRDAIRAHQRLCEESEPVILNTRVKAPVVQDLDDDFVEIVSPPILEYLAETEVPSLNSDSGTHGTEEPNDSTKNINEERSWKPLLLFVPLRLGLHESNPCYFSAIKTILKMPQTVGILGGRPRHAVWIVGVIEGDDDVLCLDPHTTQPASRGRLTDADDLSHHCDCPVRLSLKRLDPSLVLGFFCATEACFDELCTFLREKNIVMGSSISDSKTTEQPLPFELHSTRPSNMPPLPHVPRGTLTSSTDSFAKDSHQSAQEVHTLGAPETEEGKCLSDTVWSMWSKYNKLAGDTVRSFIGGDTRGTEFELV